RLDLNSFQDFYIILDDPHKSYTPNDEISGQVVLVLKKNLMNVIITLSLLGYVKVKSSISSSSFRTRKTDLFDHIICIYGNDDINVNGNDTEDEQDIQIPENGLTKGEHRFPFVVKLPAKNIYTSISFERGSISYLLRASIGNHSLEQHQQFLKDPDTKSILKCEKLLNIVQPINVSNLPLPKIKTLVVKYPNKKLIKVPSTNTSTANSSGTSITSPEIMTPNDSPKNYDNDNSLLDPSSSLVEVPSLGYLRGELIPVKISLQHIKRVQNTSGIIITLIRICKVDFAPDGPVQNFRKDLSQTIIPLFVDPTTFKTEVSSSLRIPADVFPTIVGCNMVSFQYFIEVIANLSNNKSLSSVNQQSEAVRDDENLDDIVFSATNINSANIFNVDKLKRMKNVLTLNTEVIIGTYR
ncbi:hypothetical protein PACTADRAFT_21682, partial [Pachysolen tannophilus NRRL Y-2460]